MMMQELLEVHKRMIQRRERLHILFHIYKEKRKTEALPPPSSRASSSILSTDYSLRGGSQTLSMSTWVSSGISGFLPFPKNMAVEELATVNVL